MVNTLINSHFTINIVENVIKDSDKSCINVYGIHVKEGNLRNIYCFQNKIALFIKLRFMLSKGLSLICVKEVILNTEPLFDCNVTVKCILRSSSQLNLKLLLAKKKQPAKKKGIYLINARVFVFLCNTFSKSKKYNYKNSFDIPDVNNHMTKLCQDSPLT